MTGDRMEIERPGKSNVIVGEDNITRDVTPCRNFKKYKGLRKPKCQCQPCWEKWIHRQVEKSKED